MTYCPTFSQPSLELVRSSVRVASILLHSSSCRWSVVRRPSSRASVVADDHLVGDLIPQISEVLDSISLSPNSISPLISLFLCKFGYCVMLKNASHFYFLSSSAIIWVFHHWFLLIANLKTSIFFSNRLLIWKHLFLICSWILELLMSL